LTLNAVAYGGGQFVAVGDNGTIINSPDGFNWTVRSQYVFPNLRGVAYADNEYAAVGDGGIILVSSNAETWMEIPPVTTNSLRAVTGDTTWQSDGLPQFLAVGDSETAVSCFGGAAWSAISYGRANAYRGAALDSSVGEYVVVGDGGLLSGFDTAPDPWLVETPPATTNAFYAVACADSGVVAAVGDFYQDIINEIFYSVDAGFDWTNQQWTYNPLSHLWFPSIYFTLNGVACGPNGFVAVGDTGHTLDYCYPGVVFTSATGRNWTETSIDTSQNRLYGATCGNGLYVLVGDAGGIVVSSNLVNWTEVTGYHRAAISAIACSKNLCIVSGFPMLQIYGSFPDFTTIVSTDAMNWSVSTTNMPAFSDLTSSETEFVGVSGNSIYTTIDGYN